MLKYSESVRRKKYIVSYYYSIWNITKGIYFFYFVTAVYWLTTTKQTNLCDLQLLNECVLIARVKKRHFNMSSNGFEWAID